MSNEHSNVRKALDRRWLMGEDVGVESSVVKNKGRLSNGGSRGNKEGRVMQRGRLKNEREGSGVVLRIPNGQNVKGDKNVIGSRVVGSLKEMDQKEGLRGMQVKSAMFKALVKSGESSLLGRGVENMGRESVKGSYLVVLKDGKLGELSGVELGNFQGKLKDASRSKGNLGDASMVRVDGTLRTKEELKKLENVVRVASGSGRISIGVVSLISGLLIHTRMQVAGMLDGMVKSNMEKEVKNSSKEGVVVL